MNNHFCNKKSLINLRNLAGPCGGKSTAAQILRSELPKTGVKVVFMPEVYTLLVENGIEYPGLETPRLLLHFQIEVIKLQLQLEATYLSFAEQYSAQGHDVLVVFDRGIIDIKAYVSTEMWQNLLEHFAIPSDDAWYSRYDVIIHLVTAAAGAESFYTCANNATRLETPDEARDLDQITYEVWTTHPHIYKIDNPVADSSNDPFTLKMRAMLSAIRSCFP